MPAMCSSASPRREDGSRGPALCTAALLYCCMPGRRLDATHLRRPSRISGRAAHDDAGPLFAVQGPLYALQDVRAPQRARRSSGTLPAWRDARAARAPRAAADPCTRSHSDRPLRWLLAVAPRAVARAPLRPGHLPTALPSTWPPPNPERCRLGDRRHDHGLIISGHYSGHGAGGRASQARLPVFEPASTGCRPRPRHGVTAPTSPRRARRFVLQRERRRWAVLANRTCDNPCCHGRPLTDGLVRRRDGRPAQPLRISR